MLDKLRLLRREYDELQHTLTQPETLHDPKALAKIGKRLSELEPLIDLLALHERHTQAIAFAEQMKNDPEMGPLAAEEAEIAKTALPELEKQLTIFLVPRDPQDDNGVILEVRAGAGGDEAALFATELLRMYMRYAEDQGWPVEIMSKTDAGIGGLKEAICRIDGAGAYGKLKFESGVHRVQRIPVTENKGRVHTSTATVAILPEVEEVDIQIRNEDLRIDTFRASGAGGQHVNKTESAIRITHLPTNTVVACQTERSQMRNRELAMQLLRSKLYSEKRDREAKERGQMRSDQVGSGDRSEKIRTYNFPQDRLTDHRIGENFSNLPGILEGNLEPIVAAMQQKYLEERLAAIGV